MARGRMIGKTLGSSKKFAELLRISGSLGEFAQALYPLLVSHADDFGRLSGDAFSVKYAVFPTSPRTETEFDTALGAMDSVGLIVRYVTDDGGIVAQVQQFERHQLGLQKRTKSRFPDPPVPGISTKPPEVPPELNRTELKGREPEQNGTAPAAPAAVDEIPDSTGTAWNDWRDEWNARVKHDQLPMTAKASELPKFADLARRYPDDDLRRRLIHAYFTTANKEILKKPFSLGMFLYWAPKLAEQLTAADEQNAVTKEWLAS